MSTETPEQAPNYHQAKREKIAAAIAAWQADGDDVGSPTGIADDLADALFDQGLQILPMVGGYGRYRVLIDGQPAPYIGQDRLAGPADADEAVEVFLIAALGAEESGAEHAVVIRPATDAELVEHVFQHAFGSAAPERSCACSEHGPCLAHGGVTGDVRIVDGPNGGC